VLTEDGCSRTLLPTGFEQDQGDRDGPGGERAILEVLAIEPKTLRIEPGLWSRPWNGYTAGMKTAVSIPDDVFGRLERFVHRARRSRSEVVSAAVREYLARHAPDEVTDAINRGLEKVGAETDEFVAAAARRVLKRTEW